MIRVWRNSLRGKLTVLTLGVTIGVLSLASVALLISEYYSLRAEKISQMEIISETIAANLTASIAFRDVKTATEVIETLRAVPTVQRVWVSLASGERFLERDLINTTSPSLIPAEAPTAKVLLAEDPEFSLADNSIDFGHPILLDGERIGTLTVRASLDDITARLARFEGVLLVVTLIGAIVGLVLIAKLQGLISEPIVNLAKTARAVQLEKNFSLRASGIGSDEVGRLVDAFNEMLVEIQLRDQQLNEARNSLEQRVQQRTQELRSEMQVRKQAQDALQREQEQLRSLIKHAPVAVAMMDKHLNYIAHSDRWITDFGLSESSLVSTNHLTALAGLQHKWTPYYERALKGETITLSEDKIVLPDGAERHISWTAQPWYRPTGALGGIVKVAVVIDQLIEAREAAIRSAKQRTQFLANVSHELRTPLNGIVGFAKLLMESKLPASEQTDFVQTIHQSAQLLSSLINQVLDFSKIESKKITLESLPFSPAEIIRHCEALFSEDAKSKDVVFITEVPACVPSAIMGDPTRIQQILVNLLGNALKFTKVGSITVTAGWVENSNSESVLQLSVSDTGIGIAEEKLPLIFEAFTQADGSITRRYGGTGLGLTIVKELATAMGGKVHVTSAVGVGTTFLVSLPLKRARVESLSRSQEAAGATGDTTISAALKILVAEDNRVNQKLITALLAKHGHEVTVVDNGKLAVDAVLTRQFDLVLMDLQMPEMGGIDATNEIRSWEASNPTRASVPIVALTAHAFAEDKALCEEAKMNGYLTKPIDTRKLFDTIRSVVAR